MNPEHVKVLVERRMQQAAEALGGGKYLLSAGRGAREVILRSQADYQARFGNPESMLAAALRA